MQDLIKSLHVGNIFCLMHVGNMPKEKCMYSTKMFAEKVLPQLRDVFAEWEDRWWPQPMDRAERAVLPSFQPAALAAE